MQLLTKQARLVCAHPVGVVQISAAQGWVTIAGVPVLVEGDPIGRSIDGCTNANITAGILPCKKTVSVTQGYSAFVRIDGRSVCLDNLRGVTSGSPVGLVEYSVAASGQATSFVRGST